MSPAAGEAHTVLVRSDGEVVAFGSDRQGQCQVPPLPPTGVRYIGAAAGCNHTVLLRSDGVAVAFGYNDHGQCCVPPLPCASTLQEVSIRYIAASAGNWHTVLVRSDGIAIAFGRRDEGQCQVPALPAGGVIRYVAAAAGWFHTVLLRNDGIVVAFGRKTESSCWIPRLPAGLRYVAVAASLEHTVLLRSDGVALATGRDDGDGRCSVPRLPSTGVTYVSAAAGWYHTVLLRSDGIAIAFGRDALGRCRVPALSEGLRYVAAAAGRAHTVLLRSDGAIIAFGSDGASVPSAVAPVLAVPALPPKLRYTSTLSLSEDSRGGDDSLSIRSETTEGHDGVDPGDAMLTNDFLQSYVEPLGTSLAVTPAAHAAMPAIISTTSLVTRDAKLPSSAAPLASNTSASTNRGALSQVATILNNAATTPFALRFATTTCYSQQLGACAVPALPAQLRYTAGVVEPAVAMEPTSFAAKGVFVLGEDCSGMSGAWEAVEGGAWQRLRSGSLGSPWSQSNSRALSATALSFVSGEGTAWQRAHCRAHRAASPQLHVSSLSVSDLSYRRGPRGSGSRGGGNVYVMRSKASTEAVLQT